MMIAPTYHHRIPFDITNSCILLRIVQRLYLSTRRMYRVVRYINKVQYRKVGVDKQFSTHVIPQQE